MLTRTTDLIGDLLGLAIAVTGLLIEYLTK